MECIPELCRCVSSEALKLCLCLVERWNLVGNAVLYRAGKLLSVSEKPFILSMDLSDIECPVYGKDEVN